MVIIYRPPASAHRECTKSPHVVFIMLHIHPSLPPWEPNFLHLLASASLCIFFPCLHWGMDDIVLWAGRFMSNRIWKQSDHTRRTTAFQRWWSSGCHNSPRVLKSIISAKLKDLFKIKLNSNWLLSFQVKTSWRSYQLVHCEAIQKPAFSPNYSLKCFPPCMSPSLSLEIFIAAKLYSALLSIWPINPSRPRCLQEKKKLLCLCDCSVLGTGGRRVTDECKRRKSNDKRMAVKCSFGLL